ncbi:ROK family protein [Nocardioides sp. YIM 152315]|uniref:ROK family protein n=1 Tax=Nocardioides sp. YIM 152315 TaxID=3031760 RepID=UPI0023DC75EC|nr:ROK family protein [Nocardioides sp. YIM 152315]MDF1603026.1 ROK family protein [Nocardioides sp. YIM 152315]
MSRVSLFIGVDIGGTKVLATAVSRSGRVLRTARRTTPGRRVEASLVEDALTEAVQEIAGVRRISAIGIAAAGFVDAQGERVRFAPHLPWRDEGVRARLAERWSAPVVLDNDANCAARAELTYGAVGEAANALVVTMGTGIGGAVVLNGDVFRGHNGMAGEYGHMQVVPDGRPCECGGTGCWEQYSSGNALVRFVREHGAADLTGPMVTAAAEAGDDVACAAFASVGDWLGVGLANLVAAFDPEIVVVGGGLSAAGDLLLEPARRAMRTSLVGAEHRTIPPVVRAALGPEAGAIGAADLARQTFRSAGTRARARRRAARGTARRR